MSNTLDLRGRVAVVTGGSRGLGRAIARKLSAGGCAVVVNYAHGEADARATVTELAGLPGRVSAVRADLCQPRGLDELLGRVHDQHGRLDVFVHNAARLRPMSVLNPDLAAFRDAQTLALGPLLRGAACFARRMPAGGRVIAISSNGAGQVIPGYVGVGVAKAALESLVRYLAAELAGRGIAVNAVATALLDKDDGAVDPKVAAALAARTPAGRLTTPADVADAVALLCADEASWVHGQVLTVDGGLGLRA